MWLDTHGFAHGLRQRQRIDKNTPKKESASMLSYIRCLLCGVQTIGHVYDIQILGPSDPNQVKFVLKKCDGEMSQKLNRVVFKKKLQRPNRVM